MMSKNELNGMYWTFLIGGAIAGAMAGLWIYVTFSQDHPGVIVSWLVVPVMAAGGLIVGTLGVLATFVTIDPRSWW
jgi:Mg/Co/Ni transporter MgtE